MAWLYLVRHPHTRQDSASPASRWDVSERGREQIAALAAAPFWRGVTALYASPQRKTTLAAEAVAAAHKLPLTIIDTLTEAERDRWLDPEAFEQAQRAFFARPDVAPVPGWESAESAGARFGAAMARILAQHAIDESLAVVSHASVLTLYIARLRGEPPDLDLWRGMGFATVLAVARETLRPVSQFAAAPYTDLPA